jgi:fructan beta-fructosidase
VWLGWMNCHRYAKDLPTQPWRGSFSVPRELSVRTGPQGLQLLQQPVAASESLRGAPVHAGPVQLVDEHRLLLPPAADGRAADVLLQLDGGDAADCGLLVHAGGAHGTRVGYDASRGTVYIDRGASGFLPAGDTLYPQRREVSVTAPTPAQPLRLRVLVDWSSVEVFVGDGEQVLTEQVLPDPQHRGLLLYARGGVARVGRATAWPLVAARIG